MSGARTVRCWKLLAACLAVAGVILLARPGLAQRPGGLDIAGHVFHPPAAAKTSAPKAARQPSRSGDIVPRISHAPGAGKARAPKATRQPAQGVKVIRGVFQPPFGDVEFPNAGKKPPQGGKVTQAFLHLPHRYGIHLPGSNKPGSGMLIEPDSPSKGSPPPKNVRPIKAPPGHLQPGQPFPKPWPLVRPITAGHRPIDPNRPRPWPLVRPITPGQKPVDPNRYQGPPQSEPAPGSSVNPEPVESEETPRSEPPDDLPTDDMEQDSSDPEDQDVRVEPGTTPAQEWPADERPSEPARAGQVDDKVAATEPVRQWPSVDDARGDRAALPDERLPNQKLDTDAWMTPEKTGRTDDANSLPDFDSSGMGLPSSEDIEGWGRIPGLEDNDPFADPTNPWGKGGTGRPGGPDFGPDGNGPGGNGPDFGGRDGILNLGSFDPHMPKEDGISGGSKDGFGGPGPINTNKGPAGAGQAGTDYYGSSYLSAGSAWQHFKDEQEERQGAADIREFNHITGSDVHASGACVPASCEEMPLAEALLCYGQPQTQKKKSKEGPVPQVVDPEDPPDQSGCEGPIDTGGDRPGPTSADDLNKAKAAGVLVKDPAYGQGPAVGSGVNSSNAPGHVSNPGYEGGSAAKGGSGIKSNKELVTDPAEVSKN